MAKITETVKRVFTLELSDDEVRYLTVLVGATSGQVDEAILGRGSRTGVELYRVLVDAIGKQDDVEVTVQLVHKE